MKDTEILIPRRKKITIGDKDYYVGKLSYSQWFALFEFITQNIVNRTDIFDKFKKDTKNTSDNMQDLLVMLKLLSPEQVLEFISIILKEEYSELKKIEDNIGLSEISEIILYLCEFNDIEKLKKNIMLIIERIKKMIGKKES